MTRDPPARRLSLLCDPTPDGREIFFWTAICLMPPPKIGSGREKRFERMLCC